MRLLTLKTMLTLNIHYLVTFKLILMKQFLKRLWWYLTFRRWLKPTTVEQVPVEQLRTRQQFINFIEAIPSEKIGKGSSNRSCILWHLGAGDYPSPMPKHVEALAKLLNPANDGDYADIYWINDGSHWTSTRHSPGAFHKWYSLTPKQRLLNTLNESHD